MTTERSGMSFEMTIVEAIIDKLCGRSGFDEAFDIDDEILEEIEREMAETIHGHLSRDAAVSDELVAQLRGRAAYLRDMKRVKSPQLMEQAANVIESLAARHAAAPDVPGDSNLPSWLCGSRDRMLYKAGFEECRKTMLAQRDGGK